MALTPPQKDQIILCRYFELKIISGVFFYVFSNFLAIKTSKQLNSLQKIFPNKIQIRVL